MCTKRGIVSGETGGWRLYVVLAVALSLLVPHPQQAAAQYETYSNPSLTKEEKDKDDGDELLLILIILGGIAATIIGTSSLWGPPLVLGDDYTVPGTFYEFPYEHDQPGYLSVGPEPPAETTVWGATLSTEYGYDSYVDRFGSRLTIDTTHRFGIDTEWNTLSGNFPGRPWDEMQTGDFHFTARFAQNPHTQYRVGLGMRWLDDPLDTNYGFSSLYSIDMQPVRPLTLSVNLEAGTLRHEVFFHGRATVGVVWSHLEIFTGFDYLQIDRQEIAGPMLGLRLWL